MGVRTSEVGYTPAMPRREDHEVHKGHVVALEYIYIYIYIYMEYIYIYPIYARPEYSTHFPKLAVAYSPVTTPYTEAITSNFHIP